MFILVYQNNIQKGTCYKHTIRCQDLVSTGQHNCEESPCSFEIKQLLMENIHIILEVPIWSKKIIII